MQLLKGETMNKSINSTNKKTVVGANQYQVNKKTLKNGSQLMKERDNDIKRSLRVDKKRYYATESGPIDKIDELSKTTPKTNAKSLPVKSKSVVTNVTDIGQVNKEKYNKSSNVADSINTFIQIAQGVPVFIDAIKSIIGFVDDVKEKHYYENYAHDYNKDHDKETTKKVVNFDDWRKEA